MPMCNVGIYQKQKCIRFLCCDCIHQQIYACNKHHMIFTCSIDSQTGKVIELGEQTGTKYLEHFVLLFSVIVTKMGSGLAKKI